MCLSLWSGVPSSSLLIFFSFLSLCPDDIALNGAHLLEEHDLENVFDTLPDDAFNELFQSGVYAKRTLGNKFYLNAVNCIRMSKDIRKLKLSMSLYTLLPSVIIVIVIVLNNLCRVSHRYHHHHHLLQCNKPIARPWIVPWSWPIRI